MVAQCKTHSSGVSRYIAALQLLCYATCEITATPQHNRPTSQGHSAALAKSPSNRRNSARLPSAASLAAGSGT